MHRLNPEYIMLLGIACQLKDPPRRSPRLGRVILDKTPKNKPCPCGSGHKYKKCCIKGANDE